MDAVWTFVGACGLAGSDVRRRLVRDVHLRDIYVCLNSG